MNKANDRVLFDRFYELRSDIYCTSAFYFLKLKRLRKEIQLVYDEINIRQKKGKWTMPFVSNIL